MKKVLLRADDLGYSEGVNCGIAKSARDGLIRNIGIMTNMSSVEHGLSLLEGLDVCYGQHTNICIGKPLADSALIPSLLQENGEFKSSKIFREAEEDFVVFEEVVIEIEAQLKKFIELVGEKPRYFEGHAVASKNYFKGLEYVANKHGLKYSAMPFGEEPIRIGNTDVYACMEFMEPDYDPFESLKKMIGDAHKDGCDMLICHPGYLDKFILENSTLTIPRTLEVDMLCDERTKKFIEENNVTLVTYDNL